jgi:hypothetical protein
MASGLAFITQSLAKETACALVSTGEDPHVLQLGLASGTVDSNVRGRSKHGKSCRNSAFPIKSWIAWSSSRATGLASCCVMVLSRDNGIAAGLQDSHAVQRA